SNIAQLLKPDGTLVVMDPIVARQWWGAPFDETSNSKARRVNDWVAILRRNGLEICGMFPVTYLLANPVDTKHRLSFRALSLYWSVVSALVGRRERVGGLIGDRKSTRLNSSHDQISYAVFC